MTSSGDTSPVAAHHPQCPHDRAGALAARAPGAWPLLGHLPQLCARPLSFLGGLPRYGDLVEVRLGRRRGFVVCRPELARQVLADDRTFDRVGPLHERVRAAMGNGLATCAHADHARQRPMVQPAFRQDRVRAYAPLMRQEIAAVLDGWQDGHVVDVVDEMFSLTTAVAVRTLFSHGLDATSARVLRDSLDVFLRGSYARALLPNLDRLPLPANRRYAAALAHWRAEVSRIIDRHRRAGTDGSDLLSALLAARDEEGRALTEQELHDQVAVLVLAGAETTSATLAWALHLLARAPDERARLHAEADTVLAGRTATWDDVQRLEHTTRVVRETLRLLPPAWLLPRTAVRDTELAGRRIPAGSIVAYSPYVVHRRSDLHQDADRFRPDRWRRGADGATQVPRGSFLAFGSGSTRCLGEGFALTEAVLALASIAARWELVPVKGKVRAAPRSVLCPRTLPMRLHRRTGRPAQSPASTSEA
ncbi:cytochrome P450 [Streptomyces odontomachi]|uniref:cytochrome P450 n=1 Tax=Streptomyces odontomachi TaxID=2944940 RepID=UPI00210D0ADF|nr:cytochrome P450 [Streptomyces sp. ODS25]